ncbi:MAG: hypothetical protein IAF38_19690, partial [Bacteroidia bacterium]|nr:hypothetical protein [Bacteroidia bacterium]
EDSIVMTVLIQYKVNTEKGKEYFSSFCFPESFDPLSDYFGVPENQWKKVARPVCAHCKTLTLGARKINGGKTEEIPVELIRTEESIYNSAGKIKADGTRFSIKKINTGDELQLYIRYKIPAEFFLTNSRRFFFNGVFPKQQYELWFVNSFQQTSLNFYQANKASNYLLTYPEGLGTEVFNWKADDLYPLSMQGCFRPAKELPFIALFLSKKWKDNGNLRKSKWSVVLKEGIDEALKMPFLRFRDVATPAITKFAEQRSKDIRDTNRIEKLNYLNNYIVKNFALYTIKEKLESDDRITTPDQYFKQQLIDESEKEFVYRELAKKTGNFLNYTTIFDNRYEYYDSLNYIPERSSRVCLALNAGKNNLFYYKLKNSTANYFANELPFYEENSNALIFITRNFTQGKISCIVTTTPSSGVTDNVRQIIYETTIDPDLKRISFTGKLMLSGQFSTLTRDLYSKKTADPSINPYYSKKPFPSINASINKKENVIKQSESFPFKSDIEIGFESEDMLKKTEATLSIDLTGIINHVIWDNADLSDSVLSFYNDFRFKDVYRIKLQIPAGYKLSSENSPNIKIINEFGKYEFKIVELGNNLVLLESSFLSDVDFVAPQKKYAVTEIYKAIQTNRNVVLKLQKLP